MCYNCPVPPTDPSPLAPRPLPAAIGRYRVLERLAASAYDDVYKGFDPMIQRPLVITAFGLAGLESGVAGAIRRAFFAEMPRLGLLSHPGIATLFDAGELADGLFVATEHIDGLSLAEHLAAGGDAQDAERLSLVIHLADALEHAGAQGVPHLHLKPTNILLRADFSPAVRGFGAAIVQDAVEAARGLPPARSEWAAPERQRGERGDVRADVYSLARIAGILLGASIGPGSGAPAAVLARALASDPADRFDSVGAFKYALLLALGLDEMAVRAAWEAMRDTVSVQSAEASTLDGRSHSAIHGDLTALQNPSSLSPTGAEEMVTRLGPADETAMGRNPDDSA
jgi:serine/threonine-protein kinase